MDFTAIDFETANEQSDSACQLGAVVVRGGDIVRRHCWLIRPRPMRFSSRNIAIHGITPALVREEPDFGELWESVDAVLAGQILVAHNARFDIGVLRASLARYDLRCPDLQFSCTRAVGRSAWPGQQGYGLRAIADRLGITFEHHDALEDAMACAKIMLAAAEEHGASSLEQLERQLRITRGRAGVWGCGGPRSRNDSRRRFSYGRSTSYDCGAGRRATLYQQRLRLRDPASAPQPIPFTVWLADVGQNRPLTGKSIVFTGLLTQLERQQAEQLVEAAGGICRSSVSRRTDILVVGQPDARTLRAGRTKSTKEERAEQLRSAGEPITVLSEDEFLSKIGCAHGLPESGKTA